MKSIINAIIASLVLVVGVTTSTSVLAQHHGGGGHSHYHGGSSFRYGFYFGPGFFYPPSYYYSSPYYYYPPYAAAPAAPTYYIERDSTQSAPSVPQGYWYYCNEAKAYYPYVKECPSAWQRVEPHPPG